MHLDTALVGLFASMLPGETSPQGYARLLNRRFTTASGRLVLRLRLFFGLQYP